MGATASDQLLSVARARELVVEECRALESEELELAAALGRALAEDVVAAGDAPPYASSAMDGFAIVAGEAGRRLRIVEESRAGHPASASVHEGEAVRISTGATCRRRDRRRPRRGHRRRRRSRPPPAAAAPGQHVRAAGEDVPAGNRVLAAGTELGPAAVGVAAAAGRAGCARPPPARRGAGDRGRAGRARPAAGPRPAL